MTNREKAADPNDPKWYVRAVTLPTPSHVGLEIKARHLGNNTAHYNPSVPSREVVRDENYRRRLTQCTRQGFYSPLNKPYIRKSLKKKMSEIIIF